MAHSLFLWGKHEMVLCQWTLLSQPKISPCNQAQLDVCPGAAPQVSSHQCHWWGIDNKQLPPPQQWSPEPSSLGSRPMRVEIASSNSIWLPTLRKKNHHNSKSETEMGSQKFLSVYLLHHGLLLSWTKKELCSSIQSAHSGLQVFIIYCSLRRSTLKAAQGSRLCFIHHMTHFPAALPSTSVTSDRAD